MTPQEYIYMPDYTDFSLYFNTKMAFANFPLSYPLVNIGFFFIKKQRIPYIADERKSQLKSK